MIIVPLTLLFLSEATKNLHLLPVSCGDIGFFKILGLVLAWKTGHNVPLLPLGLSCPLQTILLSDLVGCDSPLQIVMVVWRRKAFKNAIAIPV
jgi:hypothetical protein